MHSQGVKRANFSRRICKWKKETREQVFTHPCTHGSGIPNFGTVTTDKLKGCLPNLLHYFSDKLVARVGNKTGSRRRPKQKF